MLKPINKSRWQSQSSVVSMLDQVQRIQIRRIERDTFESDELVKRCYRILRGERSESDDTSSDGEGGRGGGGDDNPGELRRRSAGSRRDSRRPSNRRSSGTGGRFREVEERETVRIRPQAEPRAERRRRDRTPQPRYEYEVVHPGRIYVDVDDGRSGRQDAGNVPSAGDVSRPRRDSRVRGRYTGVDAGTTSSRGPSRERRRE